MQHPRRTPVETTTDRTGEVGINTTLVEQRQARLPCVRHFRQRDARDGVHRDLIRKGLEVTEPPESPHCDHRAQTLLASTAVVGTAPVLPTHPQPTARRGFIRDPA